MEKIFVIIDGAQYGPYTKSQILNFVKEGRLNANTMCWYEGLPQWQPLNTVFPDIFAAIPPMPPSSPPPVPNTQTYQAPNQEKKSGGKGCCLGCSVALIIFLILLAVAGFFVWKYGKVYIKTYKYNYNSSILEKPVLEKAKPFEIYFGKNEKG